MAFWRCPTLMIHSFTFTTRHHRLKLDCSVSRTVSARLTDGCFQTVCYWTLIRHNSYRWERVNNWPKFSVILLSVDLENVSLPVGTKVTCLWVIFDSELTFCEHATSVVRRCFYHTRQLRTVRKSWTTESVNTLVQTLIVSRLDYCNSVFHRMSADNLQALQSVLNPSAWLITRKRKYEHITATLILAAYSSANNAGCCKHWPSLSSFSGTSISDGAQNENDPRSFAASDHVSLMICHRLCVLHPPHWDSSKAD